MHRLLHGGGGEICQASLGLFPRRPASWATFYWRLVSCEVLASRVLDLFFCCVQRPEPIFQGVLRPEEVLRLASSVLTTECKAPHLLFISLSSHGCQIFQQLSAGFSTDGNWHQKHQKRSNAQYHTPKRDQYNCFIPVITQGELMDIISYTVYIILTDSMPPRRPTISCE